MIFEKEILPITERKFQGTLGFFDLGRVEATADPPITPRKRTSPA
jgi:hypothetical protein